MNVDIECIVKSAYRPQACAWFHKYGLSQLVVVLLLAGTAALKPLAANAQNAQGEAAYYDDTHDILQTGIDIEVVSGDFGYEPFLFSGEDDGLEQALDARSASFIVANSRNPNPNDEFTCDFGWSSINPYPFRVYNPDLTTLVGGIINGEIPQESDWKNTYCNSAAVMFNNAACGTVDGLRITSAWDGIRAAEGSPNLKIKNSWISNVRDDAVENDNYLPLVFEDNLIDGAFHGISVHSGGDISNDAGTTVNIYGSLIRIREYLYKGSQQLGALFKNEESSPTSVIHNTVVAVDYNGGEIFPKYWERSWSKIEECSNNLFLWMSDLPIPDSLPLPPACFTSLSGAEARAEWDKAKQNWINCHPKVARTASESASNPELCYEDDFGGYSAYEGDEVCTEGCH